MYLPEHFRESDPERIAELIDTYGFALLVSELEGAPCATHLPLLHERGEGPHGTLYGHVARANPQGGAFAEGQRVLAVFSGPHAYISPSWYATPGVPTWNYAAVHAYGRVRTIEDADRQMAVLDALTARYDPAVALPDSPALGEEGRRRMLAGIVVFAIEIDELQAKFKLSQNRLVEDRQRVIAQLGQDEHPDAQALAGLMLENLVRGR